jgi:hypothetical protein
LGFVAEGLIAGASLKPELASAACVTLEVTKVAVWESFVPNVTAKWAETNSTPLPHGGSLLNLSNSAAQHFAHGPAECHEQHGLGLRKEVSY